MISVEGQHKCVVDNYAGRKINPISGIIHNTMIDGTRECRSEFD
jgi:hypothetical protein